MRSRATPFGYFAGPALGRFASNTQIMRSEEQALNTCKAMAVEMSTAFYDTTNATRYWFLNPSLFESMDMYRFWEYDLSNENKGQILQQVRRTVPLEHVSIEARNGFRFKVLEKKLQALGYNSKSSKSYLNQLAQNQILVNDDMPSLFHGKKVKPAIGKIKNSDSQPLTYYPKFESAHLNLELKQQVQKALELCMLFSPRSPNAQYMEFTHAFKKMFGYRKVRLVDVLDAEFGLGYPLGRYREGNSYLNGLGLKSKSSTQHSAPSKIQKWLQEKCTKLNDDTDTIELHPEDLKPFTTPEFGFGRSFFGLVEWVQLRGQSYCYPKSFGGSSAAVLHARHAVGSEAFKNWMKHIIQHEYGFQDDHLAIEVAYLPKGKARPITIRPLLRTHVLQVQNGRRKESGINIPVDALQIHYNGKRLRLTEKGTGRSIQPYLTTAFNHHRSPSGIYRFLGDYQYQGNRPYAYFDWGNIEPNRTFLPRVVYNNILLAPKTWHFESKALEILTQSTKEKHSFIQKWEGLKTEYGLPQKVVFEKNEQSLILNTDNIKLMQLFFKRNGDSQKLILKEYLPPGEPLVKDSAGNTYASEVQVSFLQKTNNGR